VTPNDRINIVGFHAAAPEFAKKAHGKPQVKRQHEDRAV
jgi:hypothetical protein